MQKTPFTPYRGSDSTRLTSRPIRQVLPRVFQEITKLYHERPDLVLAAWAEVIGPKLAPYTQALSFVDGILVVKVKNSTLHNLLSQYDKPRIIASLKQKFPSTNIKKIQFRLG